MVAAQLGASDLCGGHLGTHVSSSSQELQDQQTFFGLVQETIAWGIHDNGRYDRTSIKIWTQSWRVGAVRKRSESNLAGVKVALMDVNLLCSRSPDPRFISRDEIWNMWRSTNNLWQCNGRIQTSHWTIGLTLTCRSSTSTSPTGQTSTFERSHPASPFLHAPVRCPASSLIHVSRTVNNLHCPSECRNRGLSPWIAIRSSYSLSETKNPPTFYSTTSFLTFACGFKTVTLWSWSRVQSSTKIHCLANLIFT